ncbi:family 20 glycosylhydrolase [Pelagicoccus albus]|uniref:Family 20 glycosylhydrolase n=2 Tax=Pelagicoccus albus TaxID=415222 RepID=A0A7X1B8A5_9BACT|nr:family 20 glycosylhydrolase [Pelagicoccus albus]
MSISSLHAEYSSNLMPVPAEIKNLEGKFVLGSDFPVAVEGATSEALEKAVFRSLRRLEHRTGLVFGRAPAGGDVYVEDAAAAKLVIVAKKASPDLPVLGEDESYFLSVSESGIRIESETTTGAQRALQTVFQLLDSDQENWFFSALEINDSPRFAWRGLMLDPCRHWQPIEVIKRNLDGMALVKMNVLHLHLSDDQGFRVESKVHPKLHELGSDGNYYTQTEIKEIIDYAAERGIRVVPEFDIPGHASSWVVGYPELASGPGPYYIERKWGVFDPTLDPTNEKVYEFLDTLFEEMTGVFPDPYFHIGGDENNGNQWSANERIQKFVKENDLEDNHGLQAYFNRRLNEILSKYNRKLVGWDEILHPDIPQSAIIQSWRGAEGLAAAAKAGHNVILSNGYYIDLIHPAKDHYLNDPLPEGHGLSEEEQARVLGGEATMWAEWVSPETIDSRVWPRTAAIAERLWSSGSVKDVDDMYRRLDYISNRLSDIGLLHDANQDLLVDRYAGDRASAESKEAIHELLTMIEPVKGYERSRQQPLMNQYIPLTGLADAARPDSRLSRQFDNAVDAVIAGDKELSSLSQFLGTFSEIASKLESAASELGPRSTEILALSKQIKELSILGTSLVSGDKSGLSKSEVETQLTELSTPVAAVDIPAVKAVEKLYAHLNK